MTKNPATEYTKRIQQALDEYGIAIQDGAPDLEAEYAKAEQAIREATRELCVEVIGVDAGGVGSLPISYAEARMNRLRYDQRQRLHAALKPNTENE